MKRINRITNEIEAMYHVAALRLGLSDSAMFILYMLYDNGGSCLLSTIHGAGVCKQTVNSAVRKLEADGILYLERCKGKNKLALFTEKGRQVAEQSVARLFEAEEKTFASWSEEEINTFVELNQKYLDCFGEQVTRL